MNKIGILIADDHSLMRVGLNALFSHQDDMEVVGEACDGLEAVKLAEGLNPDIVVMDLKMPKLDGADATMQIHAANRDVKILIFTTFGTSAAPPSIAFLSSADVPKVVRISIFTSRFAA